MKPFRMGEYWYIRQDGRLIQFENDLEAQRYCDEHANEGG